jgi:hypothetical protein
MKQNSAFDSEDQETLLTAFNGMPPDSHFQEALLQQTTRVLRLRRMVKRMSYVAGLLVCYAAGVLTMKLPFAPALAPAPIPDQGPVTVDKKPDRPEYQSPPNHPETAVALEWRALDSREKKADAYRIAGDRYLADHGDVQSALRCYRQFLEAGSHEDSAISPDDNWLLMALKEARRKEKGHAKLGG